jgi:hypothetical protein
MKRLLSTILLALVVTAGQAKEKTIVWEQPATEYGTDYGDGYFHLALDVTKVELKADETVVYITATQRSDNNHLFQFTGDKYLYLANRSPQTSWENVIKEYNVSGPNVAHYNLPEEQQAAIERHLNVHSWPTYKLFDRNGNLLDLQVDPRDLENLARPVRGDEITYLCLYLQTLTQ